ncbi:DNA (cytosine-5)-methyltransferase CMT3-like [Rosa sericea]
MATKRKTRSLSASASSSDSKKGEQTDQQQKLTRRAFGDGDGPEPKFIGPPLQDDDARKRWPKSYADKKMQVSGLNGTNKDENSVQARCHYAKAEVDGIVYDLYDDAHVKASEGEEPYICKVLEFFTAIDGSMYFTAQWYYRARDTVIKDCAVIDPKRIFFSEVQDTNPLECLLGKLNIVRLPLDVDFDGKSKLIPECDYYCDTKYLLPYSSFVNLPAEIVLAGIDTSSAISNGVNSELPQGCSSRESSKPEVRLLDLYSGCGAMSTGLCLGACSAGVNLVTKWAVDVNKHACESLKFNHPETMVRNEPAEDFLSLLKQWEQLCICFNFVGTNESEKHGFNFFFKTEDTEDEDEIIGTDNEASEVYEVAQVLEICYGDPNHIKERGLYCKIRWKGYGADEDTWEPIEELSHCKERVQEFVSQGYSSNLLPLPGDVDVICGGPPCQGISGFNRFRNEEDPLDDEKNKQLKVFMDLVQYLKPKHVLMENVVDLVKFADGFLGRYALGRLVHMNYQARMGIMAAGAYGLPQFRLRIFMWGARPTERLPQYPYPTHDVVVRGCIPTEFERNTVAYDEGHNVKLEKKLFLADAISDLPPVENSENQDEMPYGEPPQTDFQKCIRLSKNYMLQLSVSEPWNETLYDHRPLKLNEDDYARVCLVPKKKGGNFRDLLGVHVRDGVVEWDPDVDREYLDSGKPLVPNYAVSFRNGTSKKPFARLWWDETVPTVVTRAEPHNQAILHPEQDRVLSIRENARLQGFPDYYKLSGPVKQRYIQVGNAVAVPVSRSLGYALGRAVRRISDDEPLFTLPEKFPYPPEQIPLV